MWVTVCSYSVDGYLFVVASVVRRIVADWTGLFPSVGVSSDMLEFVVL